jgi:hypothetical protein
MEIIALIVIHFGRCHGYHPGEPKKKLIIMSLPFFPTLLDVLQVYFTETANLVSREGRHTLLADIPADTVPLFRSEPCGSLVGKFRRVEECHLSMIDH